MGRYIDADELHNQGWVAARYKNWEPTPLNDNFRLEVEVKPFITFSAADVVEVVRCKDCRFHEDEQIGMVYCPATVGGWVEDNWFCKGGERRND